MVTYIVRNIVENAPKWPPPEAEEVRDWFDSEPSISQRVIRELQRLKRRMKVQPFPILIVATLMTSFVVWRYSNKPKVYDAQVVLRVSQGTLNNEKGSPMPSRALTDYLYTYTLNKAALEKAILQDESLAENYPAFRPIRAAYKKGGLDAGVAALREPLGVRVFHNFFLQDRDYEGTPRSVHLAVTYTSKDPQFAYIMATKLSDLIINNESSRRLWEARLHVERADRAVTLIVDLVEDKQDRLIRAQHDLNRANEVGDKVLAAKSMVSVDLLTFQLEAEQKRLRDIRRNRDKYADKLRIEEANLAVVWELAWEDIPKVFPPPGPIRLTMLAVILFCILVPACAIGFGTIDSKVHEEEDVSRLGMPTLGHLPAFEGDQVGSLKDRGALAGRGLLSRIGFIENRRMRDNRVA